MSTTTNTGVGSSSEKAALHLEIDDAADVFLNSWKDEESLPKSAEEEKENVVEAEEQEQPNDEAEEAVDSEELDTDPEDESEEETETDDGETEGEEDEGTEEEPEPKSKTLDDDATVKVKVDDEELEVSVKDLKRLYGQEAALTKKSQQVAAKRKEVEQESMKAAAILDKLYNKAAERWKPYSEIDMLVASKQLDAEQFTALRAEAQAAWEEFNFVSQEANAFIGEAQAKQQAQLKEQAAEAVKVLKERIPSWSNNTYDAIREYAINRGMSADIVNNLVDPTAIELINKARLYDESKKVATKKKVAQPKKVLKTTAPSKDLAGDGKKQAVASRFKNTGDLDDAADVFLSRWADE